jgi:hypothetical protein
MASSAVTVELTWMELYHAASVGVMRHIRGMQGSLREPNGPPPDPWSSDIESSAAELAVAKVLNRHWHIVYRWDHMPADVGQLQVRHTRYDDGHLIVKVTDADEEVVILVTGSSPRFVLRGWMRVAEAKSHEEWLKPTPGRTLAHFVPQSALHPLDDLDMLDEIARSRVRSQR